MTEMNANPEENNRRFSWGTVVGIVLLILAGLYASQQPHGFFASLVRVFLAP
jgi:hypothetical protein